MGKPEPMSPNRRIALRQPWAFAGWQCSTGTGAFPLPLSFLLSHKDIVAEGLRQLLGEEKYRQDLTVPPGYCTGEVWTDMGGQQSKAGARLRPVCPADFLLCVGSSGAVLPVRTQDPFLPYPPRFCQQDQAGSNPTTQHSTQR